jgi:hypothetical protein
MADVEFTNIYHYIEGCGEVAFVYDHKPVVGEILEAAHVVKPLDVKDGDAMYCLSCGKDCSPWQLRLKGGEL